MAKYIFRLNTENNDGQSALQNTLKHWENSIQYGDKEIAAIKGSNDNSEHEPTSIPSPFARIALAKTAFLEVAKHAERALAAYQKIVSDSLDVAEILFTFDKWKDEIEIIKWDRKTDLPKLAQHKILNKTLKTFLDNDALTYNFHEDLCIYILKHKNTGKMIGSTSPCTLFLSSPNKLVDENGDFFKEENASENKKKITYGKISLSNNHNAFKGIFPLNKRDWNFQKYLYTWLKLNNQTRQVDNKPVSIFREFEVYLEEQKKIIDETNPNKERDLDKNNLPNDFNDYDELQAPDVCIIDDKSFHKSKASSISTINYLNTNDLLNDKIIRLPNKIQNGSFFDGNLNKNGQYGYLLPLKEEFFRHFTIDDAKKFIKINEIGNVVEVVLKISEEQKFKKIYKESDSIKKLDDFDCLLYPNLKFKEDKDAYYRFGMFLKYESKNKDNYSIDFFKGSIKIQLDNIDSITRNTNDPENALCKIYSLNQKSFDRIILNVGNIRGILIPILPSKGTSKQFTFSVDFGTTNTHIEYKSSSENVIKPFEIGEFDKQIHFLNGNNDSFKLISDIDFIPETVGVNEKFKFPIRTALSLATNREKENRVYPFVQANIVIPYEKRRIPNYNATLTQLKWESDENQMSYYIDSLCFLLRNKVALNGGDLSATKIVWFYPLSMAGSRSKTIANIWKISYVKYFLGIEVDSEDKFDDNVKKILSENLLELPESIAPYLCYKDDTKYTDAISNLMSVDIGGGTTDVVFVKDKKVEYVTSFRFAANSIFGLGEHITPVVSKYQSKIEKIIKDNDENFKLENLYNSIKNTKYGDLASFFFSLSDNEMMKNVQVNFNSMLKRDENQKLVFVLFYTAIIYHTAQIMKVKNLPMPRHISFSGNGSRIVNIVAENEILEELSKLIIEKIYGQKYGKSGLDIIHNTVNPKEVTCKGGIKAAEKNYKQTPFKPVVLLGIDNSTCADSATYATVNVNEYAAKTNVQVKAFVDFVIDDLLIQKYTKGVVEETFIEALRLNPQTLNLAKEVCAKDEDFTTFTTNGIRDKMEKVGDATTKIEEPFFFYPIAGLLNALSNEINKTK